MPYNILGRVAGRVALRYAARGARYAARGAGYGARGARYAARGARYGARGARYGGRTINKGFNKVGIKRPFSGQKHYRQKLADKTFELGVLGTTGTAMYLGSVNAFGYPKK